MNSAASNLPALLETLPTVKNQEELNQALQKLQENFNVLVPAQMNFSSPLHKVALEAVQLDAKIDPSTKNGIDIYSPDGTDKFTLHYKAANKIAGAAGINWIKSYTAKRDIGEDGRIIYAEHVVEWEIKKTNGSTKRGVTNGHYRYEEDKAKYKSNPKQIESRRRFAEGLAESNAKLRAIFEALEMLPRSFSIDQIRKPFLVPCVVEDLNELAKNDPEIRKMIAANSLGIIDKIYSKKEEGSQKIDTNIIQGATAEVVDESTVRSGPTRDDIEKQNIEIWKGYTPEQRYKQLVEFANKLGTPLQFEPVTYTSAPIERQINGLVEYWRKTLDLSSDKKQSNPAPLPATW